MPVVPTFKNTTKLPVYDCPDKGLANALNTLARAIEQLTIPDVRLPAGDGTMEWNGGDVLLRPARKVDNSNIKPWTPIFSATEDNQPQVTFAAGTINNVIPSNWNQVFNLGVLAPNTYKYIVLVVETVSGQLTGATLELKDITASQDQITKSIPPTGFEYPLGVIWSNGHQMLVTENLHAYGEIVFEENRSTLVAGDRGQDSWYRWRVESSISFV